MKVVVAGGSIAGLSAALVLARRGHDVVLLEHDSLEVDGIDAALHRPRSVGQFQHGHAFLARGRNLLLSVVPDVYADLLAAGAHEIDMCRRQPPDHRDPELVALAVRRPLIEWALIRAVRAERSIDVRDGTRCTGLVRRNGLVEGVTIRRGEPVTADLVVDALGRNSPVREWLGPSAVPEERGDAIGLYYGRFFRFLPGAPRPEMLAPIMFIRNLGYLAHTVFWEDNDVFGLALSIRPQDHELRILRHDPAFLAVARALPRLCDLMDPAVSEPVSPVVSMGGLRDVMRRCLVDGRLVAPGIISVGDALCHANPQFAYGLSFALVHAFELANAVDAEADVASVAVRFYETIGPELEERFRHAVEIDALRGRIERGEALDEKANRRLFEVVALPRATLADPLLYLTFARRLNLLDPLSVLDEDEALWQRAVELSAAERGSPRSESRPPSREEALAVAEAAVRAPVVGPA